MLLRLLFKISILLILLLNHQFVLIFDNKKYIIRFISFCNFKIIFILLAKIIIINIKVFVIKIGKLNF